jgi:hypothetical protein
MMLLKFAGGLILLAALRFPADVSIVIRTDVGVDVLSDNTSHISVSPPTTPHSHHERDTNRRAALSAITSTPPITAHTIE